MYQPHAVLAIRDRSRGVADTLIVSSRVISLAPTTWDVIREGMRRVVEEPGGTGGMARIRGTTVAGKTGTAQNPHGPDHAWFIGWTPYEAPRIAIAVVIENAGFGGSFAAPIAGACMERYLQGARTPPPAPQSIVHAEQLPADAGH
jgi:penicillin-binding protein 2